MKQAIRTILLVLLTSVSASLAAAPVGYAINSDSGSSFADSLYRIDLATGQLTRLGFVRSLNTTRIDTEGLAFAPDGTLWGMDDESMKLFPLNIDNGQVITASEVSLTGFPGTGANDFGMTFACDNNLYASSSRDDSLYKVALNGEAIRVGNPGGLGRDISALAAWGNNPLQLYGLSNGTLNSGGTASLYSIDTTSGVATLIGALGGAAAAYDQAGMSFDSAGQLWAMTDRSQSVTPQPSQILQVNTNNGLATLVSTTTGETGFESLAITAPGGCDGKPNSVPFTVITEWLFETEEIGEPNYAFIKFECQNVSGGDGVANGDLMQWTWQVKGNSQRTANIQPSLLGNTSCRATESNSLSAVEAVNGCEDWIPVLIGDSSRSCTITNNVFLEGIPTLGDYGRWLMALLLLGVGMVAVRRS